MLKQKYFLTGIFILSAERQPIKLAWRKIVWLHNVRKDGIQSESINPYIPVAAQITMDKLSGVLKNVQAGRTEYDFTGRYPNDSHSLRMPKYPKNLSLLSDSQKELLPVSHLSPCIR